MPKISVIIPVYGVEKYLRECLDSIINQTLKSLEIILVDDGSKDGCPQIIDEYAVRDKRIIPIHKENGGYGSACNTGLWKAKGKYVSIVEPDDFIDLKMYEELCQIAERFDSDIVKSQFYINLQTSFHNRISKINWKEYIPENKSFTIKEYPYFLYYHPSIWSCIYKKEFLDKNNIRFIEAAGAGWTDNPFQVQTMCLAEKINYTSKAYYYWRRLNISESDDLKDYKIPFKRSDEIHKWLEENEITDKNILKYLYKREYAYINIVLGMKEIENIEDCYARTNSMLQRMNRKMYFLPLFRLKMLIKRYRKFLLSIKISTKECYLILFGKNIWNRCFEREESKC